MKLFHDFITIGIICYFHYHINFLTFNLWSLIQTGDVNTLFRGNSLATKSFDQFMKVVGMPYLHETLKPVIDQIYEEKKMVELDPQKMDRLKR